MIKIYPFIILIAFLFVGCESKQNEKKPEQIVNITVTNPTIKGSQKEFEVNGLVESPKIIQIKNRVDGFIENQYFQDGSFVKAGDMLYKIDDRKLKNELTSLNSSLLQSKLNLANLEKTKNRIEKLVKVGGATEQELDNATMLVEKEKAISSSFEAQISKLKLDISFAIIKAPISGYIEKSQQQVGSYVTAGGTLLTQIYSSHPLYFTVMLPSHQDKPKKSTIEVGDIKYDGDLKYCDPMADGSGMVKCRYEFSPKTKITIGTIGKFIYKDALKDGLFIPQECLVQGSKGRSVYVIKNNIAYMTKIETGIWNGSDIEVINGVAKDDVIAQVGIVNLKDKAKVKIQK
jgi:membrane fusion protein, multidrug efflux system